MSFKVKIDPSSVNRALSSIVRNVEGVVKSKPMYQEIGDFTVERVKFQARTENPFNVKKKFKKLKPSTIKTRRYLEKHNATHPTYKDDRSSMTLTGQLLDGLTAIASSDGVTVKYDGIHDGYRTGTSRGKPQKNETIAQYLAEKGFVAFDDSIQNNVQFLKRVVGIVRTYLRRALRTG
jgi:hypothetical protein